MISIKQASNIIDRQEFSTKCTTRTLDSALGYCLSEDVHAPFDMPFFDNSAMDGFALAGIHKNYTIVGEIAAGDDASIYNLKDGDAVRIFTGAAVPMGTTAVMMQEKTLIKGTNLLLQDLPKEGQSIRLKGAELKKGDLVLEKGHKITPASVGLLGSLGLNTLNVYEKPLIHLITTGNELVSPGKPKANGEIYESNSYALSAACLQFGFKCDQKSTIKDDFDAIKLGIEIALKSSDVLILSGGISVGKYDYVKEALEQNGVEEQFYKVAQKPGKPLYFGRKQNKFVFALPGNPASSLSCFYLYVLPLLYKISGSKKEGLPQFEFPITHDFENTTDRPSFLKAEVNSKGVQILDGQGSSMLKSMAQGNAIAFLDAGKFLKSGDAVLSFLTS